MADSAPRPTGEMGEDLRLSGFESEVYRKVGGAELVIHIHRPADAASPSPAIVFYHGGGWLTGMPAQFGEHCKHLARKGMTGLAVEYRLMRSHGVTAWECVEDAAAAFKWTGDNAARLGIDPARIGAGGGSAGGLLAATLGTCPILSPDERPAALVLFNPILDLSDEKWSSRFPPGRWQDASPAQHVSAGLPPTVIFHGREDRTVPPEQAEHFSNLMAEAGNRCDLHLYEGVGHAFFNYARRNGFYEKTVAEMDSFLESLGWIR